MKLIVIGGSKHGEYMEHNPAQRTVIVPLMPKHTVAVREAMRYCVHGATIRSRSDSDLHFVSASRIASLYGLRWGEWRRAQDREVGAQSHVIDEYCLFPDYWGRYDRDRLPPLAGPPSMSIEKEVYDARIVSDRLVWVFVGN